MAKKSAGLILYRIKDDVIEILLVHPGGPFWQKKDLGSWSIPKGEVEDGEEMLKAAFRETEEETGFNFEENHPLALNPVKQKSGKIIYAFALKADVNVGNIKSNLFEMEWPPRSGKKQSFPEVDRAEWFPIEEAKKKIVPGQIPILEQLEQIPDL
ncbi:MAG: NUDIX domain-containing protein [Ginsengibacter sp.]